jgi:hypothetical protein
MRSTRGRFICVGLVLALGVCACASTQADYFIVTHYSPGEKAEFLVQKGINLYNDKLIEKNDIKAVPEVRGYFQNALQADPSNKVAERYLDKVDSFKAERLKTYLSYAQKLKDKKNRTDRDNYELCLSVQRAIDLNNLNSEAIKLKFETGDIRKQVIQKRVASLAEFEKKLLAEKNQANIEKALPQTAKTINEIIVLDAGNKDAERSRKNLEAFVDARVGADIGLAEGFLSRKDFPNAKLAAERAERMLKGASAEPRSDIASLKYRIAFKWAQELYALKKYESANTRVSEAIAINRTPEAIDLKNRIAKSRGYKGTATVAAPAAIDYDSDSDAIVEDIDARLAAGELVAAWGLCADALGKFKQPANKQLVEKRKASILEKMKGVYSQAVSDYNAENYEEARDGLKVVVMINPGYEQAQAYLDRTNNKLRALEGAD